MKPHGYVDRALITLYRLHITAEFVLKLLRYGKPTGHKPFPEQETGLPQKSGLLLEKLGKKT